MRLERKQFHFVYPAINVISFAGLLSVLFQKFMREGKPKGLSF